MTTTADRTTEQRLRRAAQRQGLQLRKSGRRDTRALDYGKYALADEQTNTIIAGAATGRFSFTLEDVERYLNGER